MDLEIVFRYVHFISIFTVISTVVCEHLLLKKELTRGEIRRLALIDAIYGISALVLIGAGLTLWLGNIAKPSMYYSRNWIFMTKITLVALAALLSIYPTVFFLRKRKGDAQEKIKVPAAIFWVIRVELMLFFIVPFFAVMMARGLGLIE